MNGEQTLNYKSDCLRTATNFTETIVTDICNGKIQHVPNGTMDIGFMFLGGLVMLSIAIMMLSLASRIFNL